MAKRVLAVRCAAGLLSMCTTLTVFVALAPTSHLMALKRITWFTESALVGSTTTDNAVVTDSAAYDGRAFLFASDGTAYTTLDARGPVGGVIGVQYISSFELQARGTLANGSTTPPNLDILVYAADPVTGVRGAIVAKVANKRIAASATYSPYSFRLNIPDGAFYHVVLRYDNDLGARSIYFDEASFCI